jgi:YVTN family beta-propeller protein
MLVANRGAGTVSVVDTVTDQVVQTITINSGANAPVVGYVVYSQALNRIYVGDEANNRVVILDGTSFSQLGILPTVSDVFHMWLNGQQLWVVDRTDQSVLVFDLNTNTRLARVPVPADLVGGGGAPHDVVAEGTSAYVTVVGLTGPDVVVRFDATTAFQELGRAFVGDDPHVFLHPTLRRLYVACQETDNVFVLDRDTMGQIDVVPVLGGHGVFIPPQGGELYVTNFPSHVPGGLPGPGATGIFVVNLSNNTPAGGVVTPRTGPHNLAGTPDGNKLYVTHTNGQANVTVYDISGANGIPVFSKDITVGSNPFGIAYFPR